MENIEFSFFLIRISFLKTLIDLAFFISTVSLFHSLMQYGKNVFLKNFFFEGKGLIIDVVDNLKEYFSWVEKSKYEKRYSDNKPFIIL